MAAYKQFLSSDVIVTPFEVNKGFTFLASEFTDSNVDIGTTHSMGNARSQQLIGVRLHFSF